MIQTLVGVYTDASVPAGTIPQKVATRQDVNLPKQEDLTIRLNVLSRTGRPSTSPAGPSVSVFARSWPTRTPC
jgi:hypothetical protein